MMSRGFFYPIRKRNFTQHDPLYRCILVSVVILAFGVFHGCISTVTNISVPSEITVGEEFNVIVNGTVSGESDGFAGIVLQVPESFSLEHALYNCKVGRGKLRRMKQVEERYDAQEGYYIIALVDSATAVRETNGTIQIIATFTAGQAGNFTMKVIAGGAGRKEGISGWRSTDPKKYYSFMDVIDSKYIVSCQVQEANQNGRYALQFDGIRSYVLIPAKEALAFSMDSSFTIEWWFAATSTNAVVLSTRQDDFVSKYPIEVWVNEFGSLRLTASDGLKQYSTSEDIFVADGAWRHCAIVYAASEQKYFFFLMGILKDSVSVSRRNIRNDQPMIVGSRGGRRNFLRGAIDEIRVWKKAKSQDEIQFSKNISATGSELRLFALYNFDKTSGGFILNTTPEQGIDAIAYNRPKLIPSTAPLVIEFTTFRIDVNEDSVTLLWETFDESEIEGFEVEKRLETGSYFVIAKREAQKSGTHHNTYIVTDARNQNAIYHYRLRQKNADGSVHLSEEVALGAEDIHNFTLDQNIPNPFAQSTTISYSLREPTHVVLSVYDFLGRLIGQLVDEKQSAGTHSVFFDPKDLPSGMYFFKLRTASGSETKKMILSK